jgi:transcription elongation GreA/GreB family factor
MIGDMFTPSQLKAQLYAHCLAYADIRIHAIEKTMQDAQESANSETKSSMGDKYETTRSMMQLDKVMNTKQLLEANKLKNDLLKIDIDKVHTSAQAGCLIITSQANYFIAIGAGKFSIEGNDYFVISSTSPIGTLLINRKIGDEIVFNTQKITIAQIW